MSPTALDPNGIPEHIAIIMDGNGRWASKRFLNKKAGHKAGANTLETISRAAMDLGVRHLTVYAFSTENWSRSDEEISGIMDLLRSYLKDYIGRAKRDEVKVDVIGDIRGLAPDIQEQILELERLTAQKQGMRLHIALNYGSRDELVRAVRRIAEEAAKGALAPEAITEETVAGHLDTREIPDPDLLIRTSGEKRLSNFLLWQLSYSELVFSEKLWPDFTAEDLKDAIRQYQSRDRRYGGR